MERGDTVSITRPPTSAIDEQRIAQEVAHLLNRPDSEREYRERVLITIARLEVKFDNLSERFEDHVDLDDSRHTTMTQQIGTNNDWIHKGIGIASAVVVMIGVIMWIIDKVTPK